MKLRLWALALAACAPSAHAPELEHRASCDESEDERLVVDWSALDRSKLEAAARRGVVPVRVEGCRARIVDGCTVKRDYTFAPTARQREVMLFSDRDELDARLPVLALRFGASVARASTLDVAMTVIGRYESGAAPVKISDLEGECEGATHVVASLSVGAFAIGTASAIAVDARTDIARAAHAHERTRVDAAGVEAACASHHEDTAPPDDCSVPLRVELRALRASAPPPPPPPMAPDAMRRAMDAVKKELAFCHRVARATSPDMSGTLTLSVKLARSGNVRSVAAKPEGDLDDGLAACAVERVGHVPFPASDDDRPRSVVIPILFRPLAR
ncbi:MAG TPA: hypothetical protein VIF62_18100 [Labilithrix sp.]